VERRRKWRRNEKADERQNVFIEGMRSKEEEIT